MFERLSVLAGVILALCCAELLMRPWADQLTRYDAAPIELDRLDAPVRTIYYRQEGVATAHFTPSRARLTGNAPIPAAPFIVILGDSYVEALQVPDRDTMGAVVERLSRRTPSPVNVRQYGWSGASPIKYGIEAETIKRLWRPALVVIVANADDFTSAALDTVWTSASIDGGRIGASRKPVDTASIRARVWRWSTKSALLGAAARRFGNDILPMLPSLPQWPRRGTSETAVPPPSSPRDEPHAEPFDIVSAELQFLKDAYGSSLFILYAAEPSLYAAPPEPIEMQLLARCADLGVRCASSGERVRQAVAHAEVFPSGFANTAPATGHYNADGHRLLAEIIWHEYAARLRDGVS